jgi:hypothetical protein
MQRATWRFLNRQMFLSQRAHAIRMDERDTLADTYEPRSS